MCITSVGTVAHQVLNFTKEDQCLAKILSKQFTFKAHDTAYPCIII